MSSSVRKWWLARTDAFHKLIKFDMISSVRSEEGRLHNRICFLCMLFISFSVFVFYLFRFIVVGKEIGNRADMYGCNLFSGWQSYLKKEYIRRLYCLFYIPEKSVYINFIWNTRRILMIIILTGFCIARCKVLHCRIQYFALLDAKNRCLHN